MITYRVGVGYLNEEDITSTVNDITSSIKDKINALRKHESQIERFPCSRSEVSVDALAIYRGSQAGMARAEAFSLIRRYER